MKTVLITGIGGDIAQSIAVIIREEYPEVRLVGVDMDLEHAGTLFVDDFFQVPAALSSDYLKRMHSLITKYSIDVIIPTNEQELSSFGPLIDNLGEDRCITVGKNIINIGTDKIETMNFIASLGITVPWTILAGKKPPSEFPCIFKAQSGHGSKNVFLVDNQEEATFLENKFPNSVFQELLLPEDKEVTCAVYRTRDGRISVLQLLRKLTGGITGWAKVINNKEVLKMCEVIAQGINLKGSINIQLMVTKNGPRVFEINPRFSSTVLMRHRLGFCDLLWTLNEAKGMLIDFPDVPINQCMVRIQDVNNLSH